MTPVHEKDFIMIKAVYRPLFCGFLLVASLLAQVASAQAVTKTIGEVDMQFPSEPALSKLGNAYALDLPSDTPASISRIAAGEVELPFWLHLLFQQVPDVDADFLGGKIAESMGKMPGLTVVQHRGTTLRGYPAVQLDVLVDTKGSSKHQDDRWLFSGLKNLADTGQPLHAQAIVTLIDGRAYLATAISRDPDEQAQAAIESSLASFHPHSERTPGDYDEQLQQLGEKLIGLLLLGLILVVVVIVLLVKAIGRVRKRKASALPA